MRIRYFHKAFIDTAQSLMHEFKDDNSNTLIILGANALVHFNHNYEETIKGYDQVIVYNQENYNVAKDFPWFNGLLDILHRADEVWDYTESNIELFAQHGITAKLHILKPYMAWNLYAPIQKDIDILCYGTLTPRRQALIDFLAQRYNVVSLGGTMGTENEGTFGSELDEYILRSKILLNVHNNEIQFEQEQARMVKWLGAPCQIISERSTHNYLNVPEMDYWELFCL